VFQAADNARFAAFEISNHLRSESEKPRREGRAGGTLTAMPREKSRRTGGSGRSLAETASTD
jgi:hypothetical protein